MKAEKLSPIIEIQKYHSEFWKENEDRGWKSKSRIAGDSSEKWALSNVKCPKCLSRWEACKVNEEVIDFICPICLYTVQWKTKGDVSLTSIQCAGWLPAERAKENNSTYDYLIISQYDKDTKEIHTIKVYRCCDIPAYRITKRNSLSDTARRKGWVGAVANLTDLPCETIEVSDEALYYEKMLQNLDIPYICGKISTYVEGFNEMIIPIDDIFLLVKEHFDNNKDLFQYHMQDNRILYESLSNMKVLRAVHKYDINNIRELNSSFFKVNYGAEPVSTGM